MNSDIRIAIFMTPIISDIQYWFKRRWHVFAILFALAVWGMVISWPHSGVEVIFCDVGQGDGTLIQQGFRQILVDGGPPRRVTRCLEKFMPFFDRTIDAIVVSHPQLDHFGGLEDVFKRYRVMSFVYNGAAGSSTEWKGLSGAVREEKGVMVRRLEAGEEFRVGDISFNAIWPKKGNVPLASRLAPRAVLGVQDTKDPNKHTLVLQMTYAAFDVLLTGDIGVEQEREIEKEISNAIEVLKVPHHGSKYSSSQSFLEAVRPALAVIQVGKNSYGHPTKEAIARLESVGAQVLRNDQNGDIVIKTDGKRWGVEK